MTLARTDPRPTPKEACDRCRSTRDLIVGDGPTVCCECVGLLTDAAVDPMSVSARLRQTLSELHSDIVRLAEVDQGAVEWKWLGWK